MAAPGPRPGGMEGEPAGQLLLPGVGVSTWAGHCLLLLGYTASTVLLPQPWGPQQNLLLLCASQWMWWTKHGAKGLCHWQWAGAGRVGRAESPAGRAISQKA